MAELQKEHKEEYFPSNDIEVIYAPYPGANLQKLTKNLVNHLNDTFTHMVVFTLITEAYQKVDLGEGRYKKSYDIIEAKENFDIIDFTNRFRGFEDACRILCPNIKIWLMIPPYMDLLYHNQERLRDYPTFIQEKYYRNPRFEDKEMHGKAVKVHQKLIDFRYHGTNADSYPIMFVINNCTYLKKKTIPFLKGRIRTLGDQGFLRDGIHPSRDFIDRIWRKIWDHGCFKKNRSVIENMGPSIIQNREQSTRVEKQGAIPRRPSLVVKEADRTHLAIKRKEPNLGLQGCVRPRVNTSKELPLTHQRTVMKQSPRVRDPSLDLTEDIEVIENEEIEENMLEGVRTFSDRTVTFRDECHSSQFPVLGSAREAMPSTSMGINHHMYPAPESRLGPSIKKPMLAYEFELEREIEEQTLQLIKYLKGFAKGRDIPKTDEEIKRRIKRYL